MKKMFCILMGMLLLAGVCAGQSLDGKKIAVEAGDQASVLCPVAIPLESAAPEGTIQVVDTKSGEVCPATVADGQLVFVVKKLEPKQKATFQVKVLKEKAAPKVDIKKADDTKADIVINGEHFTTYNYSNDARKPYLWPVYCEGNASITRDWPMDPNANPDVEHDHVHHKGIWTSYGDLNGVDCWGEEGDRAGFQNSDEVTFGSGDAFGWIKAKNTWQDKEHKPVIAEEREYRFYDTPASGRLFDVKVTFTAAYGDVKFTDTKEGGILAFRIRPEMQENFRYIVGKGPDGKNKFEVAKNGIITNASGATGMAGCWGKPSPWCDYSGPIKGVGMRGIAAFDNAQNLRFPTCWHVRDYGLNGANCFGLSYFTNKKEDGDYLLPSGKSLTFNYRVMIHSGNVEEAKIADRYEDYAKPPKAAWEK